MLPIGSNVESFNVWGKPLSFKLLETNKSGFPKLINSDYWSPRLQHREHISDLYLTDYCCNKLSWSSCWINRWTWTFFNGKLLYVRLQTCLVEWLSHSKRAVIYNSTCPYRWPQPINLMFTETTIFVASIAKWWLWIPAESEGLKDHLYAWWNIVCVTLSFLSVSQMLNTHLTNVSNVHNIYPQTPAQYRGLHRCKCI